MESEVQIRRARAGEAGCLAELMQAAIRDGAPAYGEAERAAWLGGPDAVAERAERIAAQTVWVAEVAGEGPVGFITLTPAGEVDFAYILARWQGRGVFAQLYAALEAYARAEGFSRLHVLASLMADGPFKRAGFQVEREDPVAIGAVVLRRALMSKTLATE